MSTPSQSPFYYQLPLGDLFQIPRRIEFVAQLSAAMLLGLGVSAIGFVLCSGLWWTAVVGGIFFVLYYPTAIEYEDRKLEDIFGDQWRKWRAETGALRPRLKPVPTDEKGSWSFLYSMRGNGEPIIALLTGPWSLC